MDPRPATPPQSEREKELQRDLMHAYETLTEITSRLLLVNEAAEATLSGVDRDDVCDKFLATAARGVSARRAALFMLEGGASLGAVHGLSDEERDALAENEADAAACATAARGRAPHVVDPDLIADDMRDALAAGATGTAADEDGDEQGEEEGAGEEEGEEEEESAEDEGDEGDEEAEAEEAGEEEDEGDDAPSFGIYIPVHLEGEPVGVLALGDRLGGRPYRNDELVFLQYLLRQFSLTVHRSMLLEQNQARLKELDALMRVSREITSTLDLDAVLRAVVNTVAAVVENDRAEIALMRGDRLVLRSVSGLTRLDPDQVELFKLGPPLEYLRLHAGRLQLSADDLGREPPPAGHAVFGEYFSAQAMRSFMALPLKDDQGLLGYLCLESGQDSWAIEPAEGDTLSILAAQATVSIRNATLYSEMPLRGMSAPVAHLRTRLRSLSARGRTMGAAAGLLGLAGLLLPVYPERAGGGAAVRPLTYQGARTMTEGVVMAVLVKGGEEVQRGQRIALVADLDLDTRIAVLRGQIEVARRDVAVARRASDVSAWRAGEIRLAALERSLAVEERRERASALAAPLAGQVLEMDLAQRVGQHLEAGESFCTVAALDLMAVDFSVGEDQIAQVRVGQPVAVKVMSFPTRTFRGQVIEVGWHGRPDLGGGIRFVVRARVENADGSLRPGMTGVAKASLGWRAPGGLLLRPILRGLQMSLPF